MPTKNISYDDLMSASLYASIGGCEYPLYVSDISIEDNYAYSTAPMSHFSCEMTGTLTIDRITFGECEKKSMIKKVIFNDPATIVFWEDGTKTVVKVQNGEKFDKMTGLAMAISKKHLGNKGNYYNEFHKWVGEEDE